MPLYRIQFYPDRVPQEYEPKIVEAFMSVLPESNIAGGERLERYVNIEFPAASALIGWSMLKPVLDDAELGLHARDGCIIVCEGEQGWDDYLLLHHYDRNEMLDHLPDDEEPVC